MTSERASPERKAKWATSAEACRTGYTAPTMNETGTGVPRHLRASTPQAPLLIDENLDRHLAAILACRGWQATDVRDHGLGGASDDDVAAWAGARGTILVTSDRRIESDIRAGTCPPCGVVLVPQEPLHNTVERLDRRLPALAHHLRADTIVDLRQDRIRVRSLDPPSVRPNAIQRVPEP